MLAGSSLPLTWRQPSLELDLETPIEKAVVTWQGPKESYGFHALETLQCMVERRKGGETGINGVRCFEGDSVWKWIDANPWAKHLLDITLKKYGDKMPHLYRENVKDPILFIIYYRSGLQAALFRLNGHVKSTAFSARISGYREPLTIQFVMQ